MVSYSKGLTFPPGFHSQNSTQAKNELGKAKHNQNPFSINTASSFSFIQCSWTAAWQAPTTIIHKCGCSLLTQCTQRKVWKSKHEYFYIVQTVNCKLDNATIKVMKLTKGCKAALYRVRSSLSSLLYATISAQRISVKNTIGGLCIYIISNIYSPLHLL